MPDPTAKYPGVTASMDPALSECLLWELAPIYCREVLTAPEGGCKAGDVIADATAGLYGMAIAPASAGGTVACVVRCAVFDGSHGTITSAAKAALEAQGVVVKDFVAPSSDTAASVLSTAELSALVGAWTAATPARTDTLCEAIEALESA
jgi:hypothetical protein